MIGDRDYKEFLNTRNQLYRERKMKEHPPSRAEALKLMSQHPNLIRRPIFVDDSGHVTHLLQGGTIPFTRE